jgi:hypothetical protein
MAMRAIQCRKSGIPELLRGHRLRRGAGGQQADEQQWRRNMEEEQESMRSSAC